MTTPDKIKPFKQGPHCVPLVVDGKRVGSISLGGDMLWIDVGGRRVLFEMHNYLGPVPCNKRTLEPLANVPAGFWDAIERWELGGRLVDGDVCQIRPWCLVCGGRGELAKHLHGKHYGNLGVCKACQGKRIQG